jgi:glycosyltransferase involved in cell wall biosynthesis
MRILFFGAAWKGSSARSLREALALNPGVDIDEVGEDQYAPIGKALVLRAASRLLVPFFKAEVQAEINRKVATAKPQVLLVYKGSLVSIATIRKLKAQGILTVNIFPDCSPHAHGKDLKNAIGEYDLVISTKPFHRGAWRTVYGYENECHFVPHGYDPEVHYWSEPPPSQDLDVVMVASCRPQYEKLLLDLATHLDTREMKVVVAGNGWDAASTKLPSNWHFPGGLLGKAYGDMVRRGKIVVAPVQTEIKIAGKSQPGDEDTTRTYELAAAHCFFLHRRTPYVETIYSKTDEVPMWDTPAELADLIREYLPKEEARRRLAASAHHRAVPAYSIPVRAREVLRLLQSTVSKRVP